MIVSVVLDLALVFCDCLPAPSLAFINLLFCCTIPSVSSQASTRCRSSLNKLLHIVSLNFHAVVVEILNGTTTFRCYNRPEPFVTFWRMTYIDVDFQGLTNFFGMAAWKSGIVKLKCFPYKCFGLACHLGVLSNIPAIGVGKNLHHVDGLTRSGVMQFLQGGESMAKDVIPLVGKSGQTWGAAVLSTPDSLKPIYISPGHRISIDSSIRVVKLCCKFRVPEPIRQADIRSRIFLQKFKGSENLII